MLYNTSFANTFSIEHFYNFLTFKMSRKDSNSWQGEKQTMKVMRDQQANS